MNSRVNRAVWIGIAILSAGLVTGEYAGALHFDWLEVIGFITGLVSVWLAVGNSHWNWPIGNINSAAYMVLFLNGRLYANTLLQFLFIVLGFWGWYQWLRGGNRATPRSITPVTRREGLVIAAVTPLSTALAILLVTAINGAAPFWDTFTTVLSLIATAIMARRQVESWLIWISADVIYVVFFAASGLYLTCLLYMIFLAMSARGYWEWRQELNQRGADDAGRDRRQVLPIS